MWSAVRGGCLTYRGGQSGDAPGPDLESNARPMVCGREEGEDVEDGHRGGIGVEQVAPSV